MKKITLNLILALTLATATNFANADDHDNKQYKAEDLAKMHKHLNLCFTKAKEDTGTNKVLPTSVVKELKSCVEQILPKDLD